MDWTRLAGIVPRSCDPVGQLAGTSSFCFTHHVCSLSGFTAAGSDLSVLETRSGMILAPP